MENTTVHVSEDIKIFTAKELASVLRIGRDKAYALIRSRILISDLMTNLRGDIRLRKIPSK